MFVQAWPRRGSDVPDDASIIATITGGLSGVTGATHVHIENLIQYAAPTSEPARPTGPIPASPYPGLAYFGPEQASLFFGREKAIQALLLAVTNRSFTALVGASGSGKSSVVLAGLAPRLETRGNWRSTYFRIGMEPDKNPFAALARAFAPLLGGDVVDHLARTERLTANLIRGDVTLPNIVAQCRSANPGQRILLIADQFEEVFTLSPDEALRNRFIDELIAAFPDPILGTPDVSLVLTLRADFVSQAVSYRLLADQLKDRVEYLGPMTREELRDAIVEPAKAVGVEFEPGLVNTILDEVNKRPGSLPLLQFGLREMWGRLKTPQMTRADYDVIGGVEGALARRSQAIFDARTDQGTDEATVALFRRLFTRLVTLGEGAEDTRRILAREELGPDAWALAQELADEDNRLVVTAAPTPGQETAEIVHEALIRNWPTLIEWVDRDREFLSWRNQLKQRIDEWRKNPADEGTFLRGGPLAVAEEWVARRGGELNEGEKNFVAAGIAARDTEKRRAEDDLKREQARLSVIAAAQAEIELAQVRARWALAAIAAVIVFAASLFYWQYSTDTLKLKSGQDQLANAQAALNTRQEQLTEAQSVLGFKQLELQHQHANLLGELASAQLAPGNFDAALRFALKGSEDDLALPSRSFPASSSMASLAAAVSQARWRLSLREQASPIASAAFSRDGSRIVTASETNGASGTLPQARKSLSCRRTSCCPWPSVPTGHASSPDQWIRLRASGTSLPVGKSLFCADTPTS